MEQQTFAFVVWMNRSGVHTAMPSSLRIDQSHIKWFSTSGPPKSAIVTSVQTDQYVEYIVCWSHGLAIWENVVESGNVH